MAKKYSATGPQIRPAPTAGSSDRKAMTTAHSTGPWMSSSQKISPPSAPWDMATTRLPLMVARTTVVNLLASAVLCAGSSGNT
ncbi:hypothetical protein D3C86_1954080 [compost metagenome]